MRIGLLITGLDVGGAEKALTELAIGLTRRGHQVRVLTIASSPREGRDGLVQKLIAEDIGVEFGGFDRQTQVLAARRWLGQRLRQFNPDISQTFLFHANTLGESAARSVGVPIRVGGLRVAEPKPIRVWLEKRAVRRMSHLVCVSRGVERFSLERLGASRDRCSVIPNGVEINRFEKASPLDWSSLDWPTDSRVVLFVGRFHSQKGLELIQQQADVILQKDASRRLLFIGDGPLRADLERWSIESTAEEARHTKRIRVIPWQADIAPFLQAASVLLLPSHYEGMPNVVLEAMAAGRPVVCSRVEGASELLGAEGEERHERQGFARGNADEMALKVHSILSDVDLAKRLGRSNQEFVASHFTYESMVDAYESLYERLLAERPRERP